MISIGHSANMNRIIHGHVLTALRTIPSESVNCIVTSPPYWGLRDYGLDPQIWGGNPDCQHEWAETISPNGNGTGTSFRRDRDGWFARGGLQPGFCAHCGAWLGSYGLEPTPELYVEHTVEIFQVLHRVLRKDGTLWLNLGDSYATGAGKVGNCPGGGDQGKKWREGAFGFRGTHGPDPKAAAIGPMIQPNRMPLPGLKPKDLVGIPWRVAFALQADGWYLRSDIIWHKPNPMPESVTDRPTKSHEYLFLMSKSERYYYDQDAIKEPVTATNWHDLTGMPYQAPGQPKQTGSRWKTPDGWDTSQGSGGHGSFHREGREAGKTGYLAKSGNKERKAASLRGVPVDDGGKSAGAVAGSVPWEGTKRNRRTVWTIGTMPFPDAHFATFPPALVEPCILAGCPEGGAVLDPFFGAGTVGLVANRLNRNFIGIDLNPTYCDMARKRIEGDAPLLTAGVIK